MLDCCMPTECSRDGGISMDHLVQTDDAAHGILHRAGSGGSALPRPDDTQATVWALQEDLCQKAATLARLQGRPIEVMMELFCVPDAELEKLGSDERRITRLNMKLRTVNTLLLAEGQSSVLNPQALLAPSGPSEMSVRNNPTVATVRHDGLASLTRDPLHSSNESGSTPSSCAAGRVAWRRIRQCPRWPVPALVSGALA